MGLSRTINRRWMVELFKKVRYFATQIRFLPFTRLHWTFLLKNQLSYVQPPVWFCIVLETMNWRDLDNHWELQATTLNNVEHKNLINLTQPIKGVFPIKTIEIANISKFCYIGNTIYTIGGSSEKWRYSRAECKPIFRMWNEYVKPNLPYLEL